MVREGIRVDRNARTEGDQEVVPTLRQPFHSDSDLHCFGDTHMCRYALPLTPRTRRWVQRLEILAASSPARTRWQTRGGPSDGVDKRVRVNSTPRPPKRSLACPVLACHELDLSRGVPSLKVAGVFWVRIDPESCASPHRGQHFDLSPARITNAGSDRSSTRFPDRRHHR